MPLARLTRITSPWWFLVLLVTLVISILPLSALFKPLFDGSSLQTLLDPRIQNLLKDTAQLSGTAAALAFLVGLPYAILVWRFQIPGAFYFKLCAPLPLLLPPLLLAQAWHGLTGWDTAWMTSFTLGLAYAPLPALLAARSLQNQSAASHEAALLAGGPRRALWEMLRTAIPGAVFGSSLVFIFTSTDFAVPDYFATVGDKFSVYAAEVFHQFRDQDWTAGARASVPLVLLGLIVLAGSMQVERKWGAPDFGTGRRAKPLRLTKKYYRIGATLLALIGALFLLLLPLSRILWETGAGGPLSDGTWLSRSAEGFSAAFNRGRADLLRSLGIGLAAGGITLVLAPFWAHKLLHSSSRKKQFILLFLSLPLLTPALGLGISAIYVFNQSSSHFFYSSIGLPILVYAGRFLPIAVFLLHERFRRNPPEQEEAATLAGVSLITRIFRYHVGPHKAAWLLAGALVLAFSVRELDLAILLPASNASAAVRYFNALHFARDNFVAAFGILMILILFLPLMIYAAFHRARHD